MEWNIIHRDIATQLKNNWTYSNPTTTSGHGTGDDDDDDNDDVRKLLIGINIV